MVHKCLKRRVISTSFTLQAGGIPLVDCQRLLIQYIRSYSPYLEDFAPSAAWVGRVAHMGDRRAEYRVLIGEPDGKRPLRKHRRRWEDNINICLKHLGWGDLNWIDLIQNRDRWQAIVNEVTNLRVS